MNTPNESHPAGPGGAIYVRVSTGQQDRETQRKGLRDYLEKQKLTVAKEAWYEDTGSRADADTRPSFQRLLRAIESGSVKWVLVLAIDRFGSADVFDQTHYLRLLYKASCGLYSVTEQSYGNIARPDLVSTILTSVAGARSTDELQARGRRNHQGKVPAASKGYSGGGLPPLGYDWMCVDAHNNEKWRLHYEGYREAQQDENGKAVTTKKGRELPSLHRVRIWPDGRREPIIGVNARAGRDSKEYLILAPSIDTDRCEVVKFIFTTFTTQDITPGEIASQLRAMGKTPPTQTGHYYAGYVKKILLNEAYCLGSVVWNKQSCARYYETVGGVAVLVPQSGQKVPLGRKRVYADQIRCNDRPQYALVTRKEWQEAQIKLSANTKPPRATKTPKYWLTGLVVCGSCGKQMNTSMMAKGYACSTYDKAIKHTGVKSVTCRNHPTNHAILEDLISQYLTETEQKIAAISELPASVIMGMADEWYESQKPTNGTLRSGYSAVLPTSHPASQSAGALDNDISKYVKLFTLMWRETKGEKRPTGKGWSHSTLVAAYKDKYAAQQSALEQQLAKEEEALVATTKRALTLKASAGPIVQAAIDAALSEHETKIRELTAKMQPMDEALEALRASVEQSRVRFEAAREVLLGANGEYRKKAAALKSIVSRIIVTHRHKEESRSEMVAVEIMPLSGEPKVYSPIEDENFGDSTSPSRGNRSRHRSCE